MILGDLWKGCRYPSSNIWVVFEWRNGLGRKRVPWCFSWSLRECKCCLYEIRTGCTFDIEGNSTKWLFYMAVFVNEKYLYIHTSVVYNTYTILYSFQVEFRLQGKQIDLETKNCRLRNGERVPCVDIDVSMSYDGIGVPSSIGEVFNLKSFLHYLTDFRILKSIH